MSDTSPSRRGPSRHTAVAFALYLAVSVVYFGWAVLHHPGRDYVGTGYDPQLFIWLYAWWPHALTHAENPLVTHAVWAPVGEDLSWVTSVPGLALALAPLTLVAGPVVAYNATAILLPALAAWTAFLLCRYATQSWWPSLAGGYLFGFSSYMLGHSEGHPNLTSVFLLPLAALLVLRLLDGTLASRSFVLPFGVLLAAQLLFSLEVFFTLTVALVVTLAATALLVTARRPALRRLPRPLAAAYGVAALLASPLLLDALVHLQDRSLNEPGTFSIDLLNPLVPTSLTAAGTAWTRANSALFVGNPSENGAYLGLPLVAIVLWFAWSRRRSAGARLLVLLIAVGLLAELGPELRIRGHAVAPLPWRAVVHLPLFQNVLPARLAVYVALLTAVVVALWAAGDAPGRGLRAALTVLAVLTLAPAFWHADWHTHPSRPAFFAKGLYRACLTPRESVLALPYPSRSNSMLWQAEHGFFYRLTDGALSPLLPDGIPGRRRTMVALVSDNVPPGGGRAVVELARAEHAGAIVVDQSEPWVSLLRSAGLRVTRIGGVAVASLAAGRAACG